MFLVKKHARSSQKTQLPGFLFPQVVQKHELGEVGKKVHFDCLHSRQHLCQLEMWANAQRDGRPAEYRWRPLFNAAVWLTPTTRLPCSNAAKDAKPLEITWGAPN